MTFKHCLPSHTFLIQSSFVKQKTRQTLNAKISQLNSAIDNVSSRLRGGGNKEASEHVEADTEVEATM